MLKCKNNQAVNLRCHAEEILIIFIMFTGALVFLFNSPLNPFTTRCAGSDSSVFKTVSMMMEKGYLPYRDSFDHKGPLLYFLNYLGNKIADYTGIWYIELIFMTITFASMYWTARCFCKPWQSSVVLIISVIYLLSYFQGGNLSEEYAMPLIAVSLFIFIDYFENHRITRVRMILCGIMFAGTLMLRPNMIAVWAVMCLAILARAVIENKFSPFFQFAGWFASGAAIAALPFLLWLWRNGILQSCWNDYILFNMLYMGGAVFTEKCKSFFYFVRTPEFLIAFSLQLYTCYKNRTMFNIAYLMLMIVTPVFISLSGEEFGHYGMILVPVIIYPLAKAFQRFNANRNSSGVMKALYAVYLVLLIGTGCVSYNNFEFISRLYKPNGIEANNRVKAVCAVLDDLKIGENEPISVYGNWDIIYVISHHPHATRYSYQIPIGQVNSKIMDEYYAELKLEQPRVIVVQNGCYSDDMKDFIEENRYSMVYGQIGEGNTSGPLVFYKE